MNDIDLQRKLRLEMIERCLNCVCITSCTCIGQLIDCECFVEVDRDKAMVIVSLKEYSELESRE